jgi:alkylation response protein AidB-like acyl-CoA dehydrogenase
MMAVEKGRKERVSRLTMQAIRLAGRDLSARGDAGDLELSGGLWRTMARGGLLGWSIPAACGGESAGFSDIHPAVEAFIAKGGRPGIALSWMVHLIVGKVLIAGFGSGAQKKEVLPGMASGKRTVSIALSEPGAGSDLKRIRTTAVKKGNSYVLDGEKAWLTNGPLADLFIVFAVTGERAGRKGFTAFLVPRETPGLTVREMPALGYLRPSPHCEIRLQGCDLPETAVLGRRGRAWEDLSKPFRVAEDVLLSGAILGGLDRELRQAAISLRERKGKIENDVKERVGGIAALLEAARQVARGAARDLDIGKQDTDVEHGLVAFHLIAKTLQESLGGLLEEQAGGRLSGTGAPWDDIARIIGLGMHASRARQRKWGDTLLIGKEKS